MAQVHAAIEQLTLQVLPRVLFGVVAAYLRHIEHMLCSMLSQVPRVPRVVSAECASLGLVGFLRQVLFFSASCSEPRVLHAESAACCAESSGQTKASC